MSRTVLKVTVVKSLGILESSPVLRKWSKRLFSSSTTLYIQLAPLLWYVHCCLPWVPCIGSLFNGGGAQLLVRIRVGLRIFKAVFLD